MLFYVAKIINAFTSTIQFLLFLASCVGQIIVQILVFVSSIVFKAFEVSVTILQIIYEDNITIFTDELPGLGKKIYESIINQCDHVLISLVSFSNLTQIKVTSFFYSIKWLFQAIYLIFSEVLILSKNCIILVGDTTWLFLTFLPIHLPQLLKACFKIIFSGLVDITLKVYGYLLRLSNFLTDVPLESFFGMMFAILLVRLCVQFREDIQNSLVSLHWLLIRQLNFLYHTVYNYVTDSEIRVITSMSGNEDIGTRELVESVIDEIDDGSDNLCVICQERQKSVLTLPCRHICLCTECCKRLYAYQRTCPICRTFIYHSVTVYL